MPFLRISSLFSVRGIEFCVYVFSLMPSHTNGMTPIVKVELVSLKIVRIWFSNSVLLSAEKSSNLK